jgi:dienelactone hydrolase
MSEIIEYEAAGRVFTGELAVPATDEIRGGVLVCHGGSGLGEHERGRLTALAARGFVAFAPDLFGERFVDRAHGMRVIGELVAEAPRLRERLRAALARLAAHPRVEPARLAAIGHCFGGLAALELARSGAELRAAVSYHGGLATREPARAGEVRARVLACTGADDPFCPRDARIVFEDELTAAGVDWQHHVYAGARHGFTVAGIDPATHPGCAYHELADRRSWQATLGLFDEVLP